LARIRYKQGREVRKNIPGHSWQEEEMAAINGPQLTGTYFNPTLKFKKIGGRNSNYWPE
jgi:hypothetical protein